jgi:predicted nucleic acid-binding protein
MWIDFLSPSEPEPNFFSIRDETDYLILYSAITEDVDLFVTGDSDFDDVEIEKPKIVTPTEYLENY